jgi:Protein of unknown function (DUF4236)
MALRFRKSFEILPGLRLNLNRRSVSLTGRIGPVSHTVSTSGRDTTSVSLPGPLSYRKETRRGRKQRKIDELEARRTAALARLADRRRTR